MASTADALHRAVKMVYDMTDYIYRTLTFPDTSEHIRFYFLVLIFRPFLFPCGRLSWLM